MIEVEISLTSLGIPTFMADTPMQTDENEVRQSLKRLKSKTAPGPDEIPGLVLKNCADQLCAVFCHLCSRSLKECHVPVLWISSNILPIPKKKNPVELNDYRPVALTPTVSKILEKVVQQHLVREVGNTFDPLQSPLEQRC